MGALDMMSSDRTAHCGAECELVHTLRNKIRRCEGGTYEEYPERQDRLTERWQRVTSHAAEQMMTGRFSSLHPARQGDVLLYDMRVLDPATGTSAPLCEDAVDGGHWAFPLRGQWDRDGRRISDKGFTLTCAADAQGKCVRFGYKPWKTTSDGVVLANYHQACIRMVRADYCGNEGTTRDGMLIDFYDQLGIQKRTKAAGDHALPFEAAWNTEGAVCVAHTRVPEHMTIAHLAQICPRLRGRLGETACTEAEAELGRLGQALLFNRSR